ncbi:MAG TPA: hypothetical protein ENJ40_04610 [Thermosulfurimonas dismutans]|uniref:Protein kinase domain-containing protein n=1 Tax=Thermosulfurimonas dismutans TaxID=999894 RepID=A0A7C3H4E6_9BACT|nr:hypothetical protein [Thermosulfurimonas dismutans]
MKLLDFNKYYLGREPFRSRYPHRMTERDYLLFGKEPSHLEDLLRWITERPETEIVKKGPKRDCLRYQGYFLKVYKAENRFKDLLNLFRLKGALRAIRNYWILVARGLSSVEPLGGWIRLGLSGSEYHSGALYPYLPEARERLNFFLSLSPSDNEFRHTLQSILTFLYQMHQAGLYLRDPKITNFILTPSRIRLIDLDGLKVYSRPREKLWRKSLNKLALSLQKAGFQGLEDLSEDRFTREAKSSTKAWACL